MKKQQKNGKIELLRFLFSIGVLWFHIEKYISGQVALQKGIHISFFAYGSMGVEFFFLVSGFLMAASVYYAKDRQKELPLGTATFQFVKNKFVSLLPMRLIVFVLLFAATIACEAWNVTTVIKKLVSYIPGFLLVQMSGFGASYINHIEWFLSAMLIGMFILYPLLRKNFDVASKIIAPLVSILILGYMFQNFGRLTGVNAWEGLVYRPMLRGIAELSLGVVCFVICQSLKNAKLSGIQRLAFTGFEAACWFAAFAMMMLTLPRKYEFSILLFIAAGTTCSFSNLSYGAKWFDNKLCFYLGKLSLPIYLCQLIPITVVPKYLRFLSVTQQMLVCFAATIVLAVATMYGANALSKVRSGEMTCQK
jgi:peptidoglycan/LPS O-acetylase OafA/YrhL